MPDPLPRGRSELVPTVLETGVVPDAVRRTMEAPARDAAALVLLYPDAGGEAYLVLTVRPDGDHAHAGQVALPGGKREPGEAFPAGTALRLRLRDRGRFLRPHRRRPQGQWRQGQQQQAHPGRYVVPAQHESRACGEDDQGKEQRHEHEGHTPGSRTPENRGVNDDEAVPLLRWALAEGYRLRFIEQMPLGPHDAWDPSSMVRADEILGALRTAFDLAPVDSSRRGADPAQTWAVDGGDPDGDAVVGVIASVTRPFCGDCDRVRLTADGQMRDCLFARHETDLRGMLRAGADDAELAASWAAAMLRKGPGHGISEAGFRQPERPMSAIGG